MRDAVANGPIGGGPDGGATDSEGPDGGGPDGGQPAVDARLSGERIEAGRLIGSAATHLNLGQEIIDRIFEGTPRDFDVIVTPRLPFGVHRAGMIGITLFGRVYLHQSARGLPPASLLLLLRHEAEHVAQQRREGILFYIRYLFGWLGLFARELARRTPARTPGVAGNAWHRAYRMIPAEREAYDAEARARGMLQGDLKSEI